MNVITGLPRSGSTLLCNVLNQNPKFVASSTSILHQMLANTVATYSTAPETRGDLGRDKNMTMIRLEDLLRGMCNSWYHNDRKKIVFDKSRSWSSDILMLKTLFPKTKVIITLRDLREVFASIEKQHRRTALLDVSRDFNSKSLFTRAESMFAPQGMIGGCLVGLRDIIDRRFDVFWCRYEDFAKHPHQMMQRLYCYLEEKPYQHHDFKDVKNTATDPDYLHLNKFPHKGEGEVKPYPISWPAFMSPDIATKIMEAFPWYNKAFGYDFNTVTPMRLPDVTAVS